ncbi:MAG TPA: serpin family protein, partial [Acidimicrobiales bacterium]|nr:serpin family protein [Acidimicrobiales bacterium]
AGEHEAGIVARGEQGFALELLQRLGPSRDNLIVSPSSLATLLAMLEPGAAGTTQTGIAHALHSTGLTAADQALGWRSLIAVLESQATSGHVTLDSANQAWLQLGLPVRSAYLSMLASDFGTGVQEQDIRSSPSKVASAINSWVASHTGGHITNFVTPTDMEQVVAVLVDAVYFEAPWATAFDQPLTAPAPFHVSSARTVSVPMMTTADPLNLAAAAFATPALDAVELPYRGQRLDALVLMPPLGQLASFEATLSPSRLNQITSGLMEKAVKLELPRFTLTTGLRLNGILSAMGMAQAFSDQADFSNLSPPPPGLKLAWVMQKAQVKVTEQGTEASAASGGGLMPTAVAPLSPLRIVVNHPFLFLVRDEATGCILFEAQVTDPGSP